MTINTEKPLHILTANLWQRESGHCVSSLVHTLAKAANGAISSPSGRNPYLDKAISETMHLADRAFELSCPINDWEGAAQEGGWQHSASLDGWIHEGERRGDEYVAQPTAEDACWLHDIEAHQREVFEHWIVSDWMADRLAEHGEKVDKDFAGLTIWARTTTGQAVYADHVIEQIAKTLYAAQEG